MFSISIFFVDFVFSTLRPYQPILSSTTVGDDKMAVVYFFVPCGDGNLYDTAVEQNTNWICAGSGEGSVPNCAAGVSMQAICPLDGQTEGEVERFTATVIQGVADNSALSFDSSTLTLHDDKIVRMTGECSVDATTNQNCTVFRANLAVKANHVPTSIRVCSVLKDGTKVCSDEVTMRDPPARRISAGLTATTASPKGDQLPAESLPRPASAISSGARPVPVRLDPLPAPGWRIWQWQIQDRQPLARTSSPTNDDDVIAAISEVQLLDRDVRPKYGCVEW